MSSIEEEEGLLSEWVHIVIMFKLSQKKNIMPIISLFAYEKLVKLLINLFSLFVSLQIPSNR